VQLASLLHAYETLGHLVADIDPLRIAEYYKDNEAMQDKFFVPQDSLVEQLSYKNYGFTEADLEREFYIEMPHQSSILQQKKLWKLKDVIAAYKDAYCNKIGVEF
jgi:2-oxoglutarate dehydrogenase complex dehydrogenase (E1) component-like enzyme